MTPKECTNITIHASEGDIELLAKPSIEEYIRREMVSYWDEYHDKEYPFEFIQVNLLCTTKENCCHKVQKLIPASNFFTRTLDDFTAMLAEPNPRQLCLAMGKKVEPKDIIGFTTGIGPKYGVSLDSDEEEENA